MQRQRTSRLSGRCLQAAVAAFAVAVFPLCAQSQTAYPVKNIRIIVPSPTGGPSDIVARPLSRKLPASPRKQGGGGKPNRAPQNIRPPDCGENPPPRPKPPGGAGHNLDQSHKG